MIIFRYLPKSIGGLYVGSGKRQSYMAEIKLNHTLRQLHNKIIECKWDYDQECWSFMRERTDKSFPNAYNTAKGRKFQKHGMIFSKIFYCIIIFLGVIKSINEPVTEDILLDAVNQAAYNFPQKKPPQKRQLPYDGGENSNELQHKYSRF